MSQLRSFIKKDLKLLFFSPMGPGVIVGYFILSSYFFLNFLGNFNIAIKKSVGTPYIGIEKINLNTWVIENYFSTLIVFFIFLIPLLISKGLVEEKKENMSELLFSYPISSFKIAISKFLSLYIFLCALLVSASLLPVLLIFLGNPEILPILAGFVSLLLTGAALLSLMLGLTVFCTSSITAGFLSMVILILLYCLQIGSNTLDPNIGMLITFFSPLLQAKKLILGVVSVEAVTYFVSLSLFGLCIFTQGIDIQRRR